MLTSVRCHLPAVLQHLPYFGCLSDVCPVLCSAAVGGERGGRANQSVELPLGSGAGDLGLVPPEQQKEVVDWASLEAGRRIALHGAPLCEEDQPTAASLQPEEESDTLSAGLGDFPLMCSACRMRGLLRMLSSTCSLKQWGPFHPHILQLQPYFP